jgi:hypothetical protein
LGYDANVANLEKIPIGFNLISRGLNTSTQLTSWKAFKRSYAGERTKLALESGEQKSGGFIAYKQLSATAKERDSGGCGCKQGKGF